MTGGPPAGDLTAGDPPEVPPPSGRPDAAWVGAAAGVLGEAGQRVVELGAGSAPLGRALVARDGSTTVTLVDDPATLAATRRAVAAAGLEARFRFVGADVLSVSLRPGAYDLVVGVHVSARHDEPTNADLVHRAARWLAPGGTLALVELLTDERGAVPEDARADAAGLAHLYPFSAYAGWLRQAGCERIERVALGSAGLTLVRARRRSVRHSLRPYDPDQPRRADPHRPDHRGDP